MIKVDKHKFQKFISGILLAFILISIGYMLGKNAININDVSSDERLTGNYIAVYYLHSTFRCETCNTIEKMTKDLLQVNYSSEIDKGIIQWQEEDFIKNVKIAKQFGVSASCVVVAHIAQGKVNNYKRLDEVWTLMKDPNAFNTYISDAIDSYLPLKEDL